MEKTLRRLTGCLLALLLLFQSVSAQQAPTVPARNSASGAAPPSGLGAGDTLVSEVLARLESHSSITAKVLMRGWLGGRSLACDNVSFPGTYMQVWNKSREKLSIRWEIEGHVEDTSVGLLQISNGDRLWTDQRLPNGRQVTEVDLRAIRRKANQLVKSAPALPAGTAGVLPMRTELSAEQGGLPSLIAGIRQNFSFSQPVSLQLSGVQVLGTIGTWRPNMLAIVNPQPKGVDGEEPLSVQPIPAHLPANVLLVVGQDDFFPYMVEFRRSKDSSPGPKDPRRFQPQADPLMLLRLYEREFDVAISPNAFRYQLDDVDSLDLTAQRIERLQRSRQARIAAARKGRR